MSVISSRSSRSFRIKGSRDSNRSRRSTARSIPKGYRVNYGPETCDDPNCAFCRTLSVHLPLSSPEQQRAQVEPDYIPLKDVGIDKSKYKFSQRTAQLDTAISMLTQQLDEKLRSERYREAKNLGEDLKDLVNKRQTAQELLDERRENMNNLMEAQRLKNEYDRLIWSAVDLDKLKKHLTFSQLASLASLKKY